MGGLAEFSRLGTSQCQPFLDRLLTVHGLAEHQRRYRLLPVQVFLQHPRVPTTTMDA